MNDRMDNLCKLTEELWNIYFNFEEYQSFQAINNILDEDCIIIGTGKHEFYKNIFEFRNAVYEEFEERKNIKFKFKDFWCEQKEIGLNECFVYGNIHIFWESEDKNVIIDMDSRFSIVYKRKENGWKIVHIHQSIPNIEQMDGEYYPKTLSEQVKQSQEKIEELKMLAERDSLTNLINFRTFKLYYERWNEKNSWLFIIDIDKFKQINDVYGHVTGNHVLQRISNILQSTIRSTDILCRMGGDEFIILCGGFETEEDATDFVQRLKRNINDAKKHEIAWTSISVGKTSIKEGEYLEEIMARADDSLYDEKRNKKKS